MNSLSIHVSSEINELKSVVVHEPGFEFELVSPDNKDHLLFDDIIYPETAREEHRQLCQVIDKISNHDFPCISFSDLLSDIISDASIRDDILSEIGEYENIDERSYDILKNLEHEKFIKALIRGRDASGNIFFKDPIINLIFTRDLAFSFGNSTVISWNTKSVRNRENILTKHLFKSHMVLNDNKCIFFHDKFPDLNVEGGDVLVIDSDTICIGITERTTKESIEALTPYFLSEGFSNILGVELPKQRSQMHLDTVFTHASKDEYLAYTPTFDNSGLFRFNESNIRGERLSHSLLDEIKDLNSNASIISCGGESCPIAQSREQWTDGANALAVSPGKIILYERNKYTLKELEKHGYKIYSSDDIINDNFSANDKFVVKINGGELSRGRGGARCLTMPLVRD